MVNRSDAFPLNEVVTLSGPLTSGNGEVFVSAMRRQDSVPTLILDFTDVPYIDSAGLGLLVSAYVSRQKAGRRTVLSGINAKVQKLFDITRVNDLFLIFSSPEEAVAALESAAEA